MKYLASEPKFEGVLSRLMVERGREREEEEEEEEEEKEEEEEEEPYSQNLSHYQRF